MIYGGLVLKVALLSKNFENENFVIAKNVLSKLLSLGCEVLMPSESEKYFFGCNKITYTKDLNEAVEKSDMSAVVGGDGSVIHYAKISAQFDKSVFGVNAGHLGFLSSCEKDDLAVISEILDGKYSIAGKMMLEARFGDQKFVALNEVAVNRNVFSHVLGCKAYIGGKPAYECRSDGIICATPTGSTAYSFSAGGPVVDSALECFVLTPVCPHSVFRFSSVVGAEHEIKLCIQGERAVISADGNTLGLTSRHENIITIKKSKSKAKIIMPQNSNLYDRIYNKLSKNI